MLSGPNGSGKTNLLEAVSLLVPGRGLRHAPLVALARHGPGSTGNWAVAARLSTPDGGTEIGTGSAPDSADARPRRVFRLDGAAPRSQAAIGARVSAVWITPQMDRLFQESAAGRRRFLDRLVYALNPGHAREVAAFETAMASRRRLLADGPADRGWLAGIEDAMARHAVAVTAARLALARRLNAALADGAAAPFPPVALTVHGALAARLADTPALAVEDWLRATLAATRSRDAAAGTTSTGAHRDDLAIADPATGIDAAAASTGQQKALLVAVVLGHAALIAASRGAAPLLLLDEPLVHLDAERRAALFAALLTLPAQTFLTGTDAAAFAPLRGHAEGLRVAAGALAPDRDFAAGSVN